MGGSITEHRTRDGRIRFRVRATIHGKRESLGLYETREEAERKLAGVEAMLGAPSRGRTVAVHGEAWLDARELDREHHRAAHKDRARWRKHIATAPFADKPIRSVESEEVRRWVRGELKQLGTQSAKNVLYLLSAFYRDAIEDGHAKTNPCSGVRVKTKPRKDQTWTYLTLDEIALVEAIPNAFARSVFVVAIYTGLREGEIWGLRWEDVRLEERCLDVCRSYDGPTKGGRVRRVPLLEQAHAALTAWRRARPGVGSALVFPSPSGGCWHDEYDGGWANRHFGKGEQRRIVLGWRARCGIDRRVRFQDLRHTCASHLVMGSWGSVWTLYEVKEWLGHRSITTTERYAHLAPESIVAKARAIRTDTRRTPLNKTGPRKPSK